MYEMYYMPKERVKAHRKKPQCSAFKAAMAEMRKERARARKHPVNKKKDNIGGKQTEL